MAYLMAYLIKNSRMEMMVATKVEPQQLEAQTKNADSKDKEWIVTSLTF